MNKTELIYLLPLIISVAISIGIWFYSWKRRAVVGASAFTWFVLAEIIYTFGYVFELLSQKIEGKIFWGNIKYFITAFGPFSVLYFSQKFTRRSFKNPIRTWILLMILPTIFILLLLTDGYHHLIRHEIMLSPLGPFYIVGDRLSPLSWLIIYYSYGVALFGVSLIVARLINSQRIFRPQIISVLIGIILPLVGVIFPLMGIELIYDLDPTHIASSLGNLVIAWSLFRYRLFDIVPIARDRLVERMQDAVIVVDNQDRVMDINLAAIEFIDLHETEISGRFASEVIPSWNDVISQNYENYENPIEIVFDNDAKPKVLSFRITELHDEVGDIGGRLIVVHDVTDLKKAEGEIKSKNRRLEILNMDLEEANEHLKKLGEVKDNFVANVSHELRTPLTNIKLYHELAAIQPERLDEFLSILARETDRLTDLIEDLLALSRFDQGILRLRKSSFDLNALIREYEEDRRSLAESKGLTLKIVEQKNIPMVYADRNLTGQILSILLTNAFNYTPKDGSVTVSTCVSNHNGRKWVGFSVQDTGMGIGPDDLENLFTRFYRGKVARKSGVSGTGLGLSIAKEIVERHKGEITVESTGVMGEGTTFKVWFAGELHP